MALEDPLWDFTGRENGEQKANIPNVEVSLASS